MVFIGTEHNGLGHAVCAFQVLRYLVRYLSDAVFNDDVVIIVGIIIDAVLYKIAVNISLVFERPPFVADIGSDIDHLKGGKEAVLNALPKAIRIYRFAEIEDARLVSRFLRRGCHTDLNGSAEVFQNFSPGTVVLGAASVALVHNNHIKKLRLKEFPVILLPFFPNQLLIERKIYFIGQMPAMRFYILLIINLVDCA